MKPYQPSNQVPSAGLTWMLLSSIIGGAAIGGITHLIARFIYLIILFPLAMGFAGGTVTAIAVRQGKVRNPSIAALFGALTGLVLYGSMHVSDYWQFKQAATAEITQRIEPSNQAEIEQLIDAFLQEKTGSTGFWGYLKYSAQEGVSIGRAASNGANLGETGTWIYWTIEFLVIDLMIAAIAYSAASSPFCESCTQWYQAKERVGSVKPQDSEPFLKLIQEDQFSKAGELIDSLAGTVPSGLEIQLERCPSCRMSDLVLTVNSAALDNKGKLNLSQVAQGLVSLSQYDKFQAAANQALTAGQERNAKIPEEIRLAAQQERAGISANDRLEPHGLTTWEINPIIQQLASYPKVKEAYLARKTLQYFPEKPFYILGIVRRVGWIESTEAETTLLNKLTKELKLPGQTQIVGLNKDKAMTKRLKQICEIPLYRKQK
jgi:hypothetical protein